MGACAVGSTTVGGEVRCCATYVLPVYAAPPRSRGTPTAKKCAPFKRSSPRRRTQPERPWARAAAAIALYRTETRCDGRGGGGGEGIGRWQTRRENPASLRFPRTWHSRTRVCRQTRIRAYCPLSLTTCPLRGRCPPAGNKVVASVFLTFPRLFDLEAASLELCWLPTAFVATSRCFPWRLPFVPQVFFPPFLTHRFSFALWVRLWTLPQTASSAANGIVLGVGEQPTVASADDATGNGDTWC